MAIDARQIAALQQLQGFSVYANSVDSRLTALETGAGITTPSSGGSSSGSGGSSGGSGYFVMPTFTAQANTLSSDSPATVTITGNSVTGYVFTFGIPKGAKGDTGAAGSGSGSGSGTGNVVVPQFRMKNLVAGTQASIVMQQNTTDGYYEITLTLPANVVNGTGTGTGTGDGTGSGAGTGSSGGGTGSGTGELTAAEIALLPPSEQYTYYVARMRSEGKTNSEIMSYSQWFIDQYMKNNIPEVTEALKQLPSFSNLLAFATSVWDALGYQDLETKKSELGENAFIRAVFNGIYGQELTNEQLAQQIQDFKDGLGNNPDVLKKVAYALVSEDVDALEQGDATGYSSLATSPETEPVVNSKYGTLTFWQTKGSTLAGYVKKPLVGISVAHKFTPGYSSTDSNGNTFTADATANIGFQLAADDRGLWYKHRIGGYFPQSFYDWHLLKDRYGLGVDTRNILCSRMMGIAYGRSATSGTFDDVDPSFNVRYSSSHVKDAPYSEQSMKNYWDAMEYGVSSGIIAALGDGTAANAYVQEEFWIYLALKFQQTKAQWTAYNMWYYDNIDPTALLGTNNTNYGAVCIPVYGSTEFTGDMKSTAKGRYDGAGILLAFRYYGYKRSSVVMSVNTFRPSMDGGNLVEQVNVNLSKLSRDANFGDPM